ncbi:MAG: type III-A CRISPR-associated RAMP protein Csm3 [candidate division WOR-3 bacterium]
MKTIKIEGKIKTKSGLHIGGMKESFKIGGVDNPVIRIKIGENELPYIPGSSIKGKIRCLLELEKGKDKPCDCNNCEICMIFGSDGKDKSITRAIFRDAYIINSLGEDTEIKPENRIDRITSKAEHPRFIERILPEKEFYQEIILNIFEGDNEKELLKVLKHGFELLEKSYLGGSGTRGYGKVDVSDIIKNIEEKLK